MAELGTGQQHVVPLFDKKGQQAGELKFRAQEEQVPVCCRWEQHFCWVFKLAPSSLPPS
jgi:hypothetical protein